MPIFIPSPLFASRTGTSCRFPNPGHNPIYQNVQWCTEGAKHVNKLRLTYHYVKMRHESPSKNSKLFEGVISVPKEYSDYLYFSEREIHTKQIFRSAGPPEEWPGRFYFFDSKFKERAVKTYFQEHHSHGLQALERAPTTESQIREQVFWYLDCRRLLEEHSGDRSNASRQIGFKPLYSENPVPVHCKTCNCGKKQ